jgi:hypothetical protein
MVWEPDGWGSRARIGLLTPHNDIVPEDEFGAMAPSGVAIHVARVPLGWSSGAEPPPLGLDAVRAFASPPRVDEAAELLAATPINVIAYAFTSSSYLLGPEGDAALKSRLEARSRGIPVVIPCPAVTWRYAPCEYHGSPSSIHHGFRHNWTSSPPIIFGSRDMRSSTRRLPLGCPRARRASNPLRSTNGSERTYPIMPTLCSSVVAACARLQRFALSKTGSRGQFSARTKSFSGMRYVWLALMSRSRATVRFSGVHYPRLPNFAFSRRLRRRLMRRVPLLR